MRVATTPYLIVCCAVQHNTACGDVQAFCAIVFHGRRDGLAGGAFSPPHWIVAAHFATMGGVMKFSGV